MTVPEQYAECPAFYAFLFGIYGTDAGVDSFFDGLPLSTSTSFEERMN